jgi:hypothetical protein
LNIKVPVFSISPVPVKKKKKNGINTVSSTPLRLNTYFNTYSINNSSITTQPYKTLNSEPLILNARYLSSSKSEASSLKPPPSTLNPQPPCNPRAQTRNTSSSNLETWTLPRGG